LRKTRSRRKPNHGRRLPSVDGSFDMVVANVFQRVSREDVPRTGQTDGRRREGRKASSHRIIRMNSSPKEGEVNLSHGPPGSGLDMAPADQVPANASLCINPGPTVRGRAGSCQWVKGGKQLDAWVPRWTQVGRMKKVRKVRPFRRGHGQVSVPCGGRSRCRARRSSNFDNGCWRWIIG
jgi:hypothetical protein